MPAPSAVDAENPWLGLASFTEETRGFFHGRDEDAAELTRRVQRKLLTVLFGQSGHGKTSLLRAGLVPRLRPEGYCPVYVRLDYTSGAPAPAEQIKEAIFRATRAAGHWTQTGSSVAGESLWEFLHHRDDVLKEASGRPLIPLLIFDQFEEIFTLAQADDAGRQRAQTFLTDLADLVENRPPAELEAKIDRDESDAAKFDFARADYRILIALREDYLAHLEGLKTEMPSVTQNRIRLARFTGAQAIAAVREPAPQLVSEAVAEQVVRFVSGGTDLARAEVEPSLLSLVCRELNNARLARHQTAITADLLEGSRETILQEFYDRALVDQPAGVRRFIEDELLTDSGYRESVAEERVRKAFAAAGAAPDALATLVGRRLLRVEERLDVRRVELTHDVLCGVVAAGRGVRREREAKEAAEAQLRATQEKEAATQRALWRARRVAFVCGLLAIGAAGSAVFGYFNYRRARVAETVALRAAAEAKQASTNMEATQEMAQEARTEAEKIVSYLLDDFYNELEPIGRLDIVGELAKRAVAYYRALPLELRSPTTVRNQALALARYGAVLAVQGKTDDSAPLLDEAIRTFERLQSNGDQSDELAIGLALAWRSQSRLFYTQGRRGPALDSAERGVESLRARALGVAASRAVRKEYAEVLNRLGFQQLRSAQESKSLGTLAECQQVLAGLGALDGSDLQAAAAYADSAPWIIEAALFLGQSDEAEKVAQQSLILSTHVLEKNPADRRALRAQALVHSYSSDLFTEHLQTGRALEASQQSERDYEKLLQLDPTNIITRNNLMASYGRTIGVLATAGRLTDACNKAEGLVQKIDPAQLPASNAASLFYGVLSTARLQAERGNRSAADSLLQKSRDYLKALLKDTPGESWLKQISEEALVDATNGVDSAFGEYQTAHDQAVVSRARIAAMTPKADSEKQDRDYALRVAQMAVAREALHLGHPSEAEAEARDAVNSWLLQGSKALQDRRNLAGCQGVLALAIARQGRQEEAAKIIAPIVSFERTLAALGEEPTQRIDLATALYVQAMAQTDSAAPESRRILAEAARLIADVPPELRGAQSTREISGLIEAAQNKIGG